MRNFILAGNVAYGGSLPLTAGAVAFTYLESGKEVVVTDASKITGVFNLEVGDALVGMRNFPMHKKNLSYVKGEYTPATTYTSSLTIGTAEAYSDYTVMIVKKGLKFNERNRWTATIHTGINPNVADIAAKLVKQINNNTIAHGIKATAAGAVITLTADTKGVDYQIIGADELVGITITTTSKGTLAYGDAAYITDLADKACADAGYEYTYRDAYTYLYPNYPLQPLKQPDSADKGYTIFTIRFAIPREVRTVEDVVNQIIQVAFPTGTAAIATFEAFLKSITTGSTTTKAINE